jgi:hypothetical protein
MRGTVKELAIGGVWCASAIGVAGWTWQAYTQQYQRFPMPGDAPSTTSADSLQQWVDLATNPIKFIADIAAKQVQKALTKPWHTIWAPLPPRRLPPPSTGKSTTPGAVVPPKGVRPHPGR